MTQKQIVDLSINPGIYTEQTERGAMGQWYSCDKVRFRKGLAEKIGGWVKIQPLFVGTCRKLKDWSSLDSKRWAAIGTDKKLYVWQDSVLYDITPIRISGTLSNPFATTNTSATVTVTHTNHGAAVGDAVRFSGASAVGGIVIVGEYTIVSVPGSNTYTIVHSAAATADANGGGTVSYEYDISSGATDVVTATGYGSGPYGAEGYGNARSGSTLKLGIRQWSLDTWGEDLLACPRGGSIYWWDRSKGSTARATILSDAPVKNEYMLISQRDRHVLALGAYDYFNQAFDPMLIRWCSTEDLEDWIPTSTNTSGDLRLYNGSKIVAGIRSRLETVIFTDTAVYTLPFIGGFDVFGLNIVGENVSILGPNAAVAIDHRVLFMAEADFYLYDGVVRTIPCSVRNHVYDNLNPDQIDKVYGGLNREFNEVWWFYPSFDPESWVQQDLTLGLPSGYEVPQGSSVPDNLYDDVLFQADFEGANGATTYTEESIYAESATFYGNAQLSTGAPIFDTASLLIADGTVGERVDFPIQSGNKAAWDGTGKILTLEVSFKFSVLPTSGTDEVIMVGDTDFHLMRLGLYVSGPNWFIRGGMSDANSITSIATPSVGVEYYIAVEADYTAGAGNGVERMWFGTVGAGTATLIKTATNQTAKDPSSMLTDIIRFGNTSSGLFGSDVIIDHVRITNSAVGRFGTASTINLLDPYPVVNNPGGSADVGYSYVFNSAGYTEIAPSLGLNTTASGYEHDYVLINDEPILAPTQAEWAVELDVNPNIGAGTGLAGMCFLRNDITGAPNTGADDADQLMVELDYDGQLVQVVKKINGTVAAPANQGTNTVDFATLTGSAMVTGQRYILTAQFNTPQVTIWVDGIQAFQFNLDASELAAIGAGGTAGIHMRENASNDNQYRFYNFSTGPVGVLTASDFDISPIEVNRYVAFNYEEGTWTVGKMARTAWADRSPLLDKPYAAGTDGYLYQHETGTDADGAAMGAFIESFDIEIPAAGEHLMHVDQLIPDFLELEGSVDVYLTGKKYPQDINRITKGPYTVSPGTRKLSTRMRARQVAFRIESLQTGAKWRMGTWRGRVGAHGRRG